MKSSFQADLEAFHSGFQACAKEVLQYLSKFENWTTREQRCAQLISHLHKVSAQFQPSAPLLQHQLPDRDGPKADAQANCVPVIQRTQNPELNENDTDTDSGYGGEAERNDGKLEKGCESGKAQGGKGVKIKQEFGDDRTAKKPKMSWSGNGVASADPANRPDLAFMNSLMGITGIGQQTPFCMPFYFLNPSAAASYMPLFDKSNLEKYVYPAAAAALTSPFPWLYPGLPAQAAAAAAAAFPGLAADKGSGFSMTSQNKDCPSPSDDLSNDAELGSPAEGDQCHENDNDGDESLRNENDGT